MNIVLNPTSTGKRPKHKLQTRFDKLRQKLLKQQKLNRKFQNELDDLVTIYQTQLFQLDSELVAPLTQLADKLIDFYTRKSLAQWHRLELGEWIVETVSRIGRVETEAADKLHSRFREVVAGQMGMTEAELDEEARLFTEAFENFEKAEATAEEEVAFNRDDFHEDMFGFDNDFEKATTDERFFEEDDPFTGHETVDAETRHQRLMDGSWVRKLFRRAAQALHPDREPDSERRLTKQRSMQQLLEARKHGDILALLQLYSENVDSDELVLAEQEITGACEIMEEQLNKIRLEKTAFIYEHPLRTLVHDLLYSSSRKTREKRIKMWKQDLKSEAHHTSDLVAELRNLKAVKAVLEERRDERIFNDLDIMIDSHWR